MLNYVYHKPSSSFAIFSASVQVLHSYRLHAFLCVPALWHFIFIRQHYIVKHVAVTDGYRTCWHDTHRHVPLRLDPLGTHRMFSDIFLYWKPTRCTVSQIYLIKYSTCFGHVHCPSSGVSQYCIHEISICHSRALHVYSVEIFLMTSSGHVRNL